MKLLFDGRVLTHEAYTGVENYAHHLLKQLEKIYSIRLIKPNTNNKYLAHFWTHLILPFYKGDILFCPANIAPIFLSRRKKLVVTIHDVAFITFPYSFSNLFRMYYRFIMPYVVRRADKIIAVSEYSKKEIEKYYPLAKGKVEVLYLGKDDTFHQRGNIKKKHQILYVGSMNERKNFQGVLKAFQQMNDPLCKLLMVGNFSKNFAVDEENKALLEHAQKQSNIEFRFNVSNEELAQLYNRSTLLIFPSFYEGFGIPVLEAMACGTPVVCSQASSLPEVGGNAVIYCNPYDTEDIKKNIALVLYDEALQQELISKGLKRARMFSWEQCAKQHIEIFHGVLNL